MPSVRSTLLCRIQSVHWCSGLPGGHVRHLRRLLLCCSPSYCATAVVLQPSVGFISVAMWLPVCCCPIGVTLPTCSSVAVTILPPFLLHQLLCTSSPPAPFPPVRPTPTSLQHGAESKMFLSSKAACCNPTDPPQRNVCSTASLTIPPPLLALVLKAPLSLRCE